MDTSLILLILLILSKSLHLGWSDFGHGPGGTADLRLAGRTVGALMAVVRMAQDHAPILLWFRLDLRLADNPVLEAAVRGGAPVIPCFIWAPEEEAPWEPGAASRWWLHHSLERLGEALRGIGSRLIIRRGPTLQALLDLAAETGARGVLWNRRYEPVVIARDAMIKEALRARGLTADSSNAALLVEPWTIQNQSGRPFQVFTPFWRACLAGLDPGTPSRAPSMIRGPKQWPRSEALDALGLLPRIPWDQGLREAWEPGEAGAGARLKRFASQAVFEYGDQRNRPDLPGTSRLSPHLHFGEIGPRQVWWMVGRGAEKAGIADSEWRRWQFLTELGWREFAHHLLYHFPETPDRPLRRDFERFPWSRNPSHLQAWRRGRTGYPLVDAGMRELWATGWMHNRVRMVVGSFLVKNLLIPWQEGARWFWDTLVDADLASNTLGWQWVAGCGADAAPYFRVFNPVSQGLKFDPDGAYVRQWIPELGGLREDRVHTPWESRLELISRAAGRAGDPYPPPIVSQSASRIAALEAFTSIRGGAAKDSGGKG